MRTKDRAAGLIDLISSGTGILDIDRLTDYKAVKAADPDATPGMPDHPLVHQGDVWTLGDHRIICGDSTDPITVRTLLGPDRPHLMVTDPPYGVEYNPDWRNHAFRTDGSPSDGRAVGTVANDDRIDWSAAWKLFPGDVAYIWHADRHASEVQFSLNVAGFVIRSQIIWNKSRFVIGRGDYHFKHESAWYAIRKGKTSHWNGDRAQTTVWDIAHISSDSDHGTQKPIECMRRPIVNNSVEGDAVYEPFSGSGTTIIAAEMERRRCFAVELNPLYVYISIVRWQNFTGRPASLDGEPFAEVFARRKDEPCGEMVQVIAPTAVPAVALASQSRPRIDALPPRMSFAPIAQPKHESFVDPFLAANADVLRAAGSAPLTFDAATWDHEAKTAVGFDVECFSNLFLVCFSRFSDGTRLTFEMSERCPLDRDGLRAILNSNLLVSFNGIAYDLPMIYLALRGADCTALKDASDKIIRGIKPWEVERTLGVRVEKLNHIDLMEPNPSVRQGIKVLHGRLHGRYMVDLPYSPEAYLTCEQMNVVTLYCFNDISATRLLWDAMHEPIELRYALSREYNMDLRSLSDAQIGEKIVVRRVEEKIRRMVPRIAPSPPAIFRYEPPAFIQFSTTVLQTLLHDVKTTEFHVVGNKATMPKELKGRSVRIGDMDYKVGIGGLHSAESKRVLRSNDEHVLIDADVTGYYARIIIALGMYPLGLGPAFHDVYRGLVEIREAAKLALKSLTKGDAEYEPMKVKVDGLKIVTLGVFGKTGAAYGPLSSPALFIATTITGQLSELMLIERAEMRGIQAVSANTDGVVFYCPRHLEDTLSSIITEVEEQTGFSIEKTRYNALFSRDVNTYLAVKEDGKLKRKGPIADPWTDGDLRGQLNKNPQMTVLSEAVKCYVIDGVPLEQTVRGCTDPRMFVTVTNVTGGAIWRGHPLGRAVRFYWSATDGDPITTTDGSRKVAKTDGAKPLLEMTDTLPDDIDYPKYIAEAERLLVDLGVAPSINT